MHPSNPVSGTIFGEGTVYGISTDLEEATDFGNPFVAKRFLNTFLYALTNHQRKETYMATNGSS
jgi:hypothetical protein